MFVMMIVTNVALHFMLKSVGTDFDKELQTMKISIKDIDVKLDHKFKDVDVKLAHNMKDVETKVVETNHKIKELELKSSHKSSHQDVIISQMQKDFDELKLSGNGDSISKQNIINLIEEASSRCVTWNGLQEALDQIKTDFGHYNG